MVILPAAPSSPSAHLPANTPSTHLYLVAEVAEQCTLLAFPQLTLWGVWFQCCQVVSILAFEYIPMTYVRSPCQRGSLPYWDIILSACVSVR